MVTDRQRGGGGVFQAQGWCLSCKGWWLADRGWCLEGSLAVMADVFHIEVGFLQMDGWYLAGRRLMFGR